MEKDKTLYSVGDIPRFAALDFETANWNRTSVCSVGIVIVSNGQIEDKLYSLVRPEPDFYSYRNTLVHGLTKRDTADAPAFPEVWAKIAPRLKGLPLVAHNSTFDEGCLKALHEHYGIPYPYYRFYCTYRLSRRLFKGLENYQLHTVSAHCGYELTDHHYALADAEACAAIMLRILQE